MFSPLTALLLTAAAPAESPEAVLKTLPAKIGAFKGGPPHVYDDPRLGASRRYADSAGAVLSIYLYDLGVQGIQDGSEDETVKKAYAQAKQDVRTYERLGHYRNLKVLEENPREIPLKGERSLKVLSVTYSFDFVDRETKKAEPVVSQLLVTGLRGQVLKLRVTRPADRGKDRAEEIEKAVRTLIRSLAGE
ncbi:MAG TPA: hypothetical protein VIL46_02895 [Gemmataceae bacterium]